MRSFFRLFTAVVTVTLLILPALPAHAETSALEAPKPSPAKDTLSSGNYQGELHVTPVITLTLIFTVKANLTGEPTVTLSVPEQGAKNVPVGKTTVTGDDVTIAMDNISATFTGKRSADGTKIVGTFTQLGKAFPLTLEKTEKPLELMRPQTPKPPFPYRSEEVSYANPNAKEVTLAGTLLFPEGKGPFPVVLFITGSGPQNRDEEILGHKSFLVIADYLARRGIASLRVDDRGTGKSTGNFAQSTGKDFATDTQAGVAYLRTRTEIDKKQIGLIGHSEGGIIAPMVAAEDKGIAFIVLLAGTGVPGDAVLLEQQGAIAKAQGVGEPQLTEYHRIMAHLYTAAREAGETDKVQPAVQKAVDEELAKIPEATREAAKAQLSPVPQQIASPWFNYFLRFDPATVLQSVQCPVLALNGSKDLQVLPKQNLPAIEKALKAGGNKDVTIHELPELNHLFQHATTGSPVEYVKITETFAPEALTILGDWIMAHTTKAP